MKIIAGLMNETIENREGNLEPIREKVVQLCSKFPLYENM